MVFKPRSSAAAHASLNDFLNHPRGSERWYDALMVSDALLLRMPLADFHARQRTSSFQDLVGLMEWIRTVCPECPRDRGWLVEQLWQHGTLRQHLTAPTEDRWRAYQEAQAAYREALSAWGNTRHSQAAEVEGCRAMLTVALAQHRVSRLADSVGVRWAVTEKHHSIFEMRGEFRRFGGGRRR